MIPDFWKLCLGLCAFDKLLAKPQGSSTCLEATEGKSSLNKKYLALGSGWSARLIFSLLIRARTFFLLNTDSWWCLVEPRRPNVYSTIYLIFSAGTWIPEERVSCREHKGPVVFKRALWTTAISLSRFYTYFLVSVRVIWFRTDGSKVGVIRQSTDATLKLSSISHTGECPAKLFL